MGPWHDTGYYLPSDQAPVVVSWLAIGVVWGAGVLCMVVFVAKRMRQARARTRAALASKAEADTAPPRPGRRVLHGEVEGSTNPVARITIKQIGVEYSRKGGKSHTWSEVERRVEAAPFVLRLGSDERVTVQPGDDVLLIGPLETRNQPDLPGHVLRTVKEGRTDRWRVAELRVKDRAYVQGELVLFAGDAYRAAGAGPLLRPLPGERMLISREPLEKRYVEQARLHSRWIVGILALSVLVHVCVFGSFWRGVLWGVTANGYVTDARIWKVKQGEKYEVTATLDRTSSREPLVKQISKEAYSDARRALDLGEPFALPIVIADPGSETSWVGTTPTVGWAEAILACIVFVTLGGVYAVNVERHRPWYEKAKVVDGGRGALCESGG
jgi:hypothetical protein